MNMLKTLTFLLLFSTVAWAQNPKPLTHEDYHAWKNISKTDLSRNGKVLLIEVETATDWGDGYLEIHNTETGYKNRFHNGYQAVVSFDENYVFFKRKPDYEVQRQEKKDKVKKDKLQKDVFFIFDVQRRELIDSLPNIKNFKTPKKYEGWVAIQKIKEPADKKKPKDSTATKKKHPASEDDYIIIIDLKNNRKDSLFRTADYEFSEEKPGFFFSKKPEKKKTNGGVFAYDFKTYTEIPIDTGKVSYKHLAANKSGSAVAYLAAKDSIKNDSLRYELTLWKQGNTQTIVNQDYDLLPENWRISMYQSPEFSKRDQRLYFYAKPHKELTVDTTMLKDEKAEVDVWVWTDKMIQPEQQARKKQLTEKAYTFYFDLTSQQIVQLNLPEMDDLTFDRAREKAYILGSDSRAYDVARSWDFPWLSDYYAVHTPSGNRKKILDSIAGRPELHPTENKAVYYDHINRQWFVVNLENGTTQNLTTTIPTPLFNEDDDHPAAPPAHGFGGWTADGQALVYDKYDIWMLDIHGKEKPVNLTQTGRDSKTVFRTLRLDPEEREFATQMGRKLLLSAFDEKTKGDGIYTIDLKNLKLEKLVAFDNFGIQGIQKAKEKDVFVYRKHNFQTYPDVILTDKTFKTAKILTDVNPQQKDYAWGSVELVKWNAYDGVPLEGLLYKPANFDPNKKYPMVVYFYEKRSETLHSYITPSPSRSTVNMSYLTSNGYLVFVPDIVYKDGYPGQSAYNCIVSGVEALEKLPFVDSSKMALQGQSWGGYQTAYLITKTDKFAAAMAGAPVSNMTSAYGGIRWQSGLNRAFQYEKTQTRIGKNLWDGFDLYIENSPLFSAPNVNTPLLMMHNDADGAVPYYQGIEFFMGLRRLDKPVWLLVYNKEAHNLTKMKNRMDLSIRMMQFFDHYLKGAPQPQWMVEGVPITEKGLDYGYELLDGQEN
ncbi:MAG: prolyl oligopeptidase family serine peptidase [Bacteroidetes bacterium]|nr:prolyl oligopeptidase family serine peptidase [Bacteroidota bacterium]